MTKEKEYFEFVVKRDGRLAPFDIQKIADAIFKAAKAVGGEDKALAYELAGRITNKLKKQFGSENPTVEQLQDTVERELIETGHARTAKAYILYRQKRSEIRDSRAFLAKVDGVVDGYVLKHDWRVSENSNASYSLSGLQAHASGAIIAEYTLNHIYPKEISEAHRQGDFHIHDLGTGTFCGYSFYRNETVIVREKKTRKLLVLGLEQLFDLVDSGVVEENGFEIKYTNKFEIADENGWTDIERVLRHKTEKRLISFNSTNGKNLIVTSDHPFITLKDEFEEVVCSCGSKDVFKNRSNKNGFDYFKCRSCGKTFKKKIIMPNSLLREEKYAEGMGLNNYLISPKIEALAGFDKRYLSWQDGWFIGFFVAEGYFKTKGFVEFELTRESVECQKLLSYLDGVGAHYTSYARNRTATRNSPISLQEQEQAVGQEMLSITIKLSTLPEELQYLIMPIRRHSENKNLPVEFANYSDEVVGSMIAGVIDGDGVVRNDDKWVSRANIRVTSKTLLSQIQFWLYSKGINASLSTIDSFGEREYNNTKIISKKQLYSLTIYISEGRARLFSESIKINSDFKFSKKDSFGFADISKIRKIEEIENDSEYVYDISTESHTFLCNGVLAHNCAGWSLRQLLMEGFNGVPGRIAAKAAKHFNAALGQIVNFFGTLQNEWAGAQAFSSFDTYLAPLAARDNLDYKGVKQSIQEFVFAVNSTSRWGNQVPFTNLTLDWTVPEDMAGLQAVYGGELLKETYSEFQNEMDLINKAFIEVMIDGDMNGRIFTFPIPTYNITRDFDWNSENANLLFEMTAKYGIPYFQNFINSSLKPQDVRSMCCRLQLDLRDLKVKTGGLFGSGESTGSIGVVSLNMPRIGYLSKSKEEFFGRVEHLMYLAKESLEIKRKEVMKNMENGLLPYTKRYLGHLNHHFSTIGLVGMNEACLNFLGKDIASDKGKQLASEVLDLMRENLMKYQKETGHIFNLEATPAEGTSYRLARVDKKKHPKIITVGKDVPYYTNSTNLPVNYTEDIFDALEHQDELQCKYTGGTVLHGFIGEHLSSGEACKKLVKRIAYKFKLPYYTITPTFSICPVHGYIAGEHFRCPVEVKEKEAEKIAKMQ